MVRIPVPWVNRQLDLGKGLGAVRGGWLRQLRCKWREHDRLEHHFFP